MVRKLLENLRRRLGVGILSRAFFSLALAFLLWGWVTNQDDPVIEQAFPTVAPTIIGKPGDLVLLGEERIPGVVVTLRGPRSELNRLTPLDLQVTVDLRAIGGSGSDSVGVNATVAQRSSAQVVRISPQTVAITTDRLVSKSFTPEVEKGSAIPPYSIGNVDLNPKQVAVKGPSSLVNQVARVVLPVTLGTQREAFEAPFTPEARDNAGARVNGVTIEPNSLNATVAIDRVGRTVSIVPNIQGLPADGYRVTTTRVSPPAIVVDGPSDALAQLIVVSTGPIDVAGRRESFSVFDIALTLPNGTRVVERNAINVEVQIDAEQQRQQIGGVRINYSGLGTGLRLTANTPTEATVTLSGPRDSIRQLSAGAVQVQVDLRGLGVGTHTVTPTVIAPTELRADPPPPPYTVQIERIPASPTPTPTPSPAPPTATPTLAPTPAPVPLTATPIGRAPLGRREGGR